MNTSSQNTASSDFFLNSIPQGSFSEILKTKSQKKKFSSKLRTPTRRTNSSAKKKVCIIVKTISKKPLQPSKERKGECLKDITNENTPNPGDEHFTEVLKNALSQALDENEELRKRVAELEALLSAAQDEIEKREQAILELAEVLEKTQKGEGNKMEPQD